MPTLDRSFLNYCYPKSELKKEQSNQNISEYLQKIAEFRKMISDEKPTPPNISSPENHLTSPNKLKPIIDQIKKIISDHTRIKNNCQTKIFDEKTQFFSQKELLTMTLNGVHRKEKNQSRKKIKISFCYLPKSHQGKIILKNNGKKVYEDQIINVDLDEFIEFSILEIKELLFCQ